MEDTSPYCFVSSRYDCPPQAGRVGGAVEPAATPAPECPICFSPYDGAFRCPLQLPRCGHTFCLVCLSRISLFPPTQGFQCPLCRTPVPLPPGGAPCLPPNMELVSQLPQGPTAALKRVWLEGPVLCHWTGAEGGGAAAERVVRLPLTGAPAGGGTGELGGAGQPVAMVTVLSRRRAGGCSSSRTPHLALLSLLLFIGIFIGIFLPVYLQC